MKKIIPIAIVIAVMTLSIFSCRQQAPQTELMEKPALTNPSPPATGELELTLPVLDALFADVAFKAELKSKLQRTDEQITALGKISSEEVAKLRRATAANQSGDAEASR